MGRLFWKFFLLLSLAQIATAIVVGSYIRWEISHQLHINTMFSSHQAALRFPPFPDFDPEVFKAQPPLGDDGLMPPPPPPPQTGLYFLWMVLCTFPLTALVISLMTSMLFAWLLALYIYKPIHLLKAAFSQAENGDLQVRIADKIAGRRDELAELGTSFDQMLTRLQALMQSQSGTLHHVSHELRSPLARIHMAIGLAMQSPSNVADALKRLELEVHRMELMIAQLLEIAHFQSGLLIVKKEPVNMNAIIKTIIADASFEFRTAKLHFIESEAKIVVLGQEDLLHRAVENVIRNAVKYSPPYTDIRVELSVSHTTNEVILEVRDQGEGVLESELESIFKPFVRGAGAKSTEGHGIGLALTKYVVEAHLGYVLAMNLQPNGFVMRIHLPI